MFPVDSVLLLTGLLCVESGRMAGNISIARLTHKQLESYYSVADPVSF
jgi:hypothetical protein